MWKKIKFPNIDANLIKTEIKTLKKTGINISFDKNNLFVEGCKKKKIKCQNRTISWFSNNLQAQIMVLMTQAKGISPIKENIFENRFMHVSDSNNWQK